MNNDILKGVLKQMRILFIGRCGYSLETPIGGEVSKNRTTYKYLREKHDVSLVDILYGNNAGKKYVERLINTPSLVLRTIIKGKEANNIVIDSFHDKFFSLLNKMGYLEKTIYITIGRVVGERIQSSRIGVEGFAKLKCIVVESESMADELKGMGLNNVKVNPNYKFLPNYEKRFFSGNKDVLKLFYLGAIRKEKGIQVLIDSVKILNSSQIRFEIHLYGEVVDGFDLNSQLNEYIFFDGRINLHDKVENYDILREYDIFVFPSEWYAESISGAMIDALAVGVPILASKHNLNHLMVAHGKNGFLFEKGNVKELSNYLDYFYNNQENMIEMGNVSLEMSNSYSVENAMKTIGLCE